MKKFKKLKNFKTINFSNYSYSRFKRVNEDDYKNFSFVCSDELISEIISLEKNFDKFIKCKYPKILMISSHAFVSDILSRLFISFSKHLKQKFLFTKQILFKE